MKSLKLTGIVTALFLAIFLQSNAQSWGKYTLVAPQGSSTVKLIDLNGTAYKTWNLSGNNGYSCVLTPDRCIVRTAGGSGIDATRIEKINWDGKVVWTYNISVHHDICVLPNGNVLATVRTTATSAELSALGFTGGTTTVSSSLTYDKIVEIDGVNQKIVWEWRFIDHLVQNVKSSASNYGVPADHPERFNIQVRGTGQSQTPGQSQGYGDWVHLNGLDYNPQRDQIVFSSKYLQEIFVIDHSTTTEEAKTGSGGLSGKGGDFLYRWGNPSNYGKTNTSTNVFGTIHNATWAIGETYRAQNTDPAGDDYHVYANQITVFSNTNVAGMTINPPYTPNSFLFDYTAGTAYAPTSYNKKVSASGRSTNMGCAQALPNGNMLIYLGSGSTVYEYNSSSTLVWSSNTANGCSRLFRYSEAYVNGDYASICANVPIGVLGNNTTTYHTVSASAGANGSISPSGDISVRQGGNQIFVFTPDDGYQIQSVLVDGVANSTAQENGYYIFSNVTDNHEILVTFAWDDHPATYYTISTSAGENGSISPSGNISVKEGNSQTFVFMPDNGSKINSVLIDGVANSTAQANGYYTFSNVTGNHEISVTFTEIVSGIESVIAHQLKIFPNPARDEIFITSDYRIKKVEIYSLTGRLLLSDSNFNERISVSHFPQGVYLVIVYVGNGFEVKKIVKE